MRRLPELTAAEFNVMKALWRLGKATVADTRAELARGGPELAYTTVMTLLGRLAAKSAVTVDKSREPFVYEAAFRRESVLRERLRDFLHHVFDGEAGSLVLRLVENEALSLDELRDIERRIEGADASDADAPDADAGSTPASDAAPRRARKKKDGGRR